ncbi:MAG: SDR family oxidoreductase, partial [Planctomycetota bacterium]|nr:SDR family oxidoreductase [Planctomycetota bacterium]
MATNTDNGRLALVTGASKGIGLAITRMLLTREIRVIGVYGHDKQAAMAAKNSLGALAINLTMIQVDLSRLDGIDHIVRAVDAAGGVLHYLISNIGVTDKTPFGQVSPKEWELVLKTNLTVPFFLIQELAGRLKDDEGRVVFIGAVMGIKPHAISFSYGASKAGLHFLAQSLVKIMSPRGITVNVVA